MIEGERVVGADAAFDDSNDRASGNLSLNDIPCLKKAACSSNAVELVTGMADQWWDKPAECFELLGETDLLSVLPRPVRTVALFYFSIGIGGGERVTASVASQLVSNGMNVVLFTDVEPTPEDFDVPETVTRIVLPGQSKGDYASRCIALASAINEYEVDAMVYCQWLSHALPWDMLLCKLLDVYFVVYSQSTMRTMFCEADPVDFQLSVPYRYLDGLIVLSETDRAFWSMTVPRVWKTYNPCTLIPGSVARSKLDEPIVLWLGRLSEFDKRPSEALRIMALVHKKMPDAKLLMVGPAPNEWAQKQLEGLVSELGAEEYIRFEGPTNDVASYYQKASVYLLTSRYEGWCLSLAESKAMGVPCVSYNLPYLSLFEGCRGMLVVRQRDREAAADAVCNLLEDVDLRRRLGDDAFLQAKEMADFDHSAFWDDVIARVQEGTPARTCLKGEDLVFGTLLEGGLESLDKLTCRIGDLSQRVNNLQGWLDSANEELSVLRRELSERDDRIEEMRNSTIWKVGSAATWLPRAIKDGMRKE